MTASLRRKNCICSSQPTDCLFLGLIHSFPGVEALLLTLSRGSPHDEQSRHILEGDISSSQITIHICSEAQRSGVVSF